MEIYDYVFHFNSHTQLWYAIPRDKYLQYWSEKDVEGVMKSKDMSVLVSLISMGKEFVDSL
jgi:hypothetical protein